MPASHWLVVNHHGDIVVGCLARTRWGWVKDPTVVLGASRAPAQIFLAPPFSSPPPAVPSCAWTLISFMQAQPYGTSPHAHAMCLFAPASCPGDTVSWAYTHATQKCSVNPWETAATGHMLSFLPQNDWPFHKDQTTGYRYQGPVWIGPSFSFPLLLFTPAPWHHMTQ